MCVACVRVCQRKEREENTEADRTEMKDWSKGKGRYEGI